MSTPTNTNVFARIHKIDEAKRLIYARAVQETPDRSDEIFDYEASKPHFEKWSQGQFDASGGKSYGNVRAMHGNQAAGKVAEPMSFNDTDKAIDVVIKVVDDGDWKKALEGVYTGVSMGGKYVPGSKKVEKIDGKDVTRYTAIPSEISLVDIPCIPTATFFDIVKADGTEIRKAFAGTTAEVAEKIDAQTEANADGTAKIVDALAQVADAVVAGIAKDGTAKEDAKALALKRAEALVKCEKAIKPLHALAALFGDTLEKGLYSVSRLADLLCSLGYLASDATAEAAWEGDNSTVPEALRGAVKDLGAVLCQMADEEVAELVASIAPETPVSVDVVTLAAGAADLEKVFDMAKYPNEDLLKLLNGCAHQLLTNVEKKGATLSAASKSHLQDMHTSLTKLAGTGMCEDATGANDEDDTEKAAAADLRKRYDADQEIASGLGEALGLAKGFGMADLVAKVVEIAKDRSDLTEMVAKANTEIAGLNAKFNALPAMGKGLRMVERSTDYQPPEGSEGSTEIAPIKKADGTIDEGATLTKKLISGRPTISF